MEDFHRTSTPVKSEESEKLPLNVNVDSRGSTPPDYPHESTFTSIRVAGAEPTRLIHPAKKPIERIMDFVMLLCSILFLVFAWVGFSLDKKPVAGHEWGKQYLNASKLAPTIFPIVFGVIVGNLTAVLARYRLERGDKIGVIEQLQASSSLAKTLMVGYKLRKASLAFLGLFVLWALSPVGGQASLRIVEIQSVGLASTRQVAYIPDNVPTVLEGASAVQAGGFNLQSLFTASVISPQDVRNSSTDWAGNVKIPFAEYLPGFAADQKNYPIHVGSAPTYSSLIGVQILDLPTHDNEINSFPIQSTYFTLDCPVIANITTLAKIYADRAQVQAATNPQACVSTPGVPVAFQGTANVNNSNLAVITPTIIQAGNTTNSILTRKKLDFYFWRTWTRATCYATEHFVEASVVCNGTKCGVDTVKPLTTPPDAGTNRFAKMDECSTLSIYMQWFINVAATPSHAGTASLLDAYIVNPLTPFVLLPTLFGTVLEGFYANVTKRDFEIRLSQLMNTFWRASLITLANYGSSPTFDPTTRQLLQQYKPINLTATSTIAEDRYMCNKVWLGLVVLCSLAMLTSAVLGTYVGLMLWTPDILGWASSLTRDNSHCPLPLDPSAMDGLERTRRLGDARVQLKDVGSADPGSPYGHLSLTWALDGGASGKQFDHKKTYC